MVCCFFLTQNQMGGWLWTKIFLPTCRQGIGCSYISDLPYYKRAVWFEMKRLPLVDYPKQQLEDFSRYVFGVKYAILTEVMARLVRT